MKNNQSKGVGVFAVVAGVAAGVAALFLSKKENRQKVGVAVQKTSKDLQKIEKRSLVIAKTVGKKASKSKIVKQAKKVVKKAQPKKAVKRVVAKAKKSASKKTAKRN